MTWWGRRSLRRRVDEASRSGRRFEYNEPADRWAAGDFFSNPIRVGLHATAHNCYGFILGLLIGIFVTGFITDKNTFGFWAGFASAIALLLLLYITAWIVRQVNPLE